MRGWHAETRASSMLGRMSRSMPCAAVAKGASQTPSHFAEIDRRKVICPMSDAYNLCASMALPWGLVMRPDVPGHLDRC